MKIVLVGTAFPYRGGLAKFNESLMDTIQKKGHEAIIFNFKLQYPSFLFPGKSQYSDESNTLPPEIQNLRKVNSINPFNWIKIGLELKSLAPDMIIFRYWLPFMAPCYSVIAWIAKLNGKTKITTVIDNAIPHEPKFYDIPVTKLFFYISDYFIAMAENVRQDFRKLSSKSCALHHHPMYENYGPKISKLEARTKLAIDPEDKIILFFGFIRDYKGLDLLIESVTFPEIKERKIKLIIAGEFYVDSKPYFDLVAKLGIQDSIIWKNDFIPDSEVSTFFCAADVVVLPYKSATQSGITQIAYYYELPVIATDVGGLRELIPHERDGLICEPSIQSIALSISRYFSENLNPIYSENMKIDKAKYSWNNFVNCMLEMIK
jgi:glycosyltransferase involved in cell wall biosynthesis